MAYGATEQQQARGPWADGELRTVNGKSRARRIDQGAGAVDQHGIDAGRGDIHAEIHQVGKLQLRIRDALACTGVSDYPLSN
jgi:hypothetical protein